MTPVGSLGTLPSVVASGLHAGIVLFGLMRLRRTASTRLFLAWMGFNSVWCAANVGIWAGAGKFFDLAAGISITFAPASMFLFSLALGKDPLPRKYLLVYLIPCLVWVPSEILGSAAESAPQFGMFQMPAMLALDIAAGLGWYSAWRRNRTRSVGNGAFVLLALNLPAVLVAGASYYVSYFVASTPLYLAWFGDLVIGLASMLSLIVVLAVYSRNDGNETRQANALNQFGSGATIDACVAKPAAGAAVSERRRDRKSMRSPKGRNASPPKQ